MTSNNTATAVLLLRDVGAASMDALLARFDMELVLLDAAHDIPGSYWGESEAGLLGNRLYARPDTPVHSVLHEAGHFICMDCERRAGLERDAGGDYDEENAVCYLQIVLADEVPGMDRRRMCDDMDSWGYTFRLGSASVWFERDAQDARMWLENCGILDASQKPTWRVRTSVDPCRHRPALHCVEPQ